MANLGNLPDVIVLGAGYTGLTTAAELSLRGHTVHVIAKDMGYINGVPLTIAGTQSRRWPGTANSNAKQDNDELLRRELLTLSRFVSLAGQPESGVHVVPALKVSRQQNNTWNRRPIPDPQLLAASTEVQRNLRLATKSSVSPNDKECFYRAGYKSVDETQVVKVESAKYARYLMGVIKRRPGSQITMGVTVSAEDIDKLSSSCKLGVINCLGLNAKIGDPQSEYRKSPGEVVIMRDCPKDFPFYVMDDDLSAGVMQCPDGSLYLSTGADPDTLGAGVSKQTVADCDLISKALFGSPLDAAGVCESHITDRPLRTGGFNVQASKLRNGRTLVQNTGHGGAGVAASWGCASMAADALLAASAPQSRL